MKPLTPAQRKAALEAFDAEKEKHWFRNDDDLDVWLAAWRSSRAALGDGWMPIETAPKGEIVDIWIPHKDGGGVRWASCHYDSICDEWRKGAPGERLVWVPARCVTHWRKEPQPPTSKPGEEG